MDTVVLSKVRRDFKKGYLPGWTEEKFKVLDRISSEPATYRILDSEDQLIRGSFYADELQLVQGQ